MYRVIVSQDAFKELAKLAKKNQQRVYQKLKLLESGPFSGDKPLQGKHQGKYRKRAVSFRIIYLRENTILLITVIRFAHRKEVY